MTELNAAWAAELKRVAGPQSVRSSQTKRAQVSMLPAVC